MSEMRAMPTADMRPTGPVLAARTDNLRKIYGQGDAQVAALAGVTIGFERGQFTAVMGASGSGKSTLMHCVAGLDAPTSGAVFIGDTEIGRLRDKELTLLRRERVDAVLLGCPLARITATSKDAQLLTLAVCLQLPVLAVFESAAEAQAARGQVDAITDALIKPLGIDDVQHALAQRLLVVGEGKSAGS